MVTCINNSFYYCRFSINFSCHSSGKPSGPGVTFVGVVFDLNLIFLIDTELLRASVSLWVGFSICPSRNLSISTNFSLFVMAFFTFAVILEYLNKISVYFRTCSFATSLNPGVNQLYWSYQWTNFWFCSSVSLWFSISEYSSRCTIYVNLIPLWIRNAACAIWFESFFPLCFICSPKYCERYWNY